jgi:hypothetical protein
MASRTWGATSAHGVADGFEHQELLRAAGTPKVAAMKRCRFLPGSQVFLP